MTEPIVVIAEEPVVPLSDYVVCDAKYEIESSIPILNNFDLSFKNFDCRPKIFEVLPPWLHDADLIDAIKMSRLTIKEDTENVLSTEQSLPIKTGSFAID